MSIEDLLERVRLVSTQDVEAYRRWRTGAREAYPGEYFVSRSLLTPERLAQALASELDLPFVPFAWVEIDESTARRIPASVARNGLCVPVLEEPGGETVLATGDPLNLRGDQDIEFAVGRPLRRVVTTARDVLEAIARLYPEGRETPAAAGAPVEADAGAEADGDGTALDMGALLGVDDPKEGRIASLVQQVLESAIELGASDIHFEPAAKSFDVKGRVDGMLQDMLKLPKDLQENVTSRLKILGQLDIGERRHPQDGRIRISHQRRVFDLRVSTLPSFFGEKVVLRILDPSRIRTLDFASLGFSDGQLELVRRAVECPQGMILVTGPTGSGKTTTLYAALLMARARPVNIITIEDPIEYQVDGITQVQVDARIGFTFASALRSVLRQDPNVVLVGEIRDDETAQTAFRAAMTGHLVLSTVHTNDTVESVARLRDLGLDASVLYSALLLVVAQRLVRLNCRECPEPYDPEPAALARLGLAPGGPYRRGRGCPACRSSGYKGRLGVYEFLPVTGEVRRLIAQDAPLEAIRSAALAGGMVPLREGAVRLVREGRTTVEEALRVAPGTG